MKARLLIASLGLAIVWGVCAQAKQDFGVGIILGEPTGLTIKRWVSGTHAVDAGLAWSFTENASFHLHADYLVHSFDLVDGDDVHGWLPWYFGLGARIKLQEENDGKGRNDEDDLVGIRVPLGVAYMFADSPIDIFAEIVPILDLVPATDFDLNAAIGARFYF